MAGLLRRLLPMGLAVLASICFAAVVSACPFCTMQGQTLTQEVDQASMVLYGTLQNANLSPNGFGDGTTDLAIEAVIKRNDILGDQKVITLNRYVPVDKEKKYKFVIFCDVYKGKIDPYRGIQVKADCNIAAYLDGALKVKGKDIGTRLRYFFDYLDNDEVEISNDAYKEFGNANYADYRDMAKKLPADKIAAWLQDPKTPSFRYGLYASMLGHCGNAEHAKLLRSMLDEPKRLSSGIDGVLAGYILLEPVEGPKYLFNLLKDPTREFTVRYAALRTARFFWDSRPDVIGRTELLNGVCQLLDQADIADLAIEDLRKWKCWEVAGQVLALREKPTHNLAIIRRAILRYALSCPERLEASAYVAEVRKKDPRLVKDTEELLRLENATK
jgi:hypothetical protein